VALRVVTSRRRPKPGPPLTLKGAVLGLICLVGWRLLGGPTDTTQNGTKAESEGRIVTVLVPRRDVGAGMRLRTEDFEPVRFDGRAVPLDAVTSAELVRGASALRILPAGLPVSSAYLAYESLSGPNAVVERIPPGMRAITVKVDATASVEGWAGSGSTVDVLLIEKSRSSVVAEKVRVLSAERSVSPLENGAIPNVPSTVTLLVSQEQAAVPLGRITFALRNVADEAPWKSTTYSADRILVPESSDSRRGNAVTGYASVKEGGSVRRFALANGKWLPTSSPPDGFLSASRESQP
jgi:Flp pilus assembly protein CpaB